MSCWRVKMSSGFFLREQKIDVVLSYDKPIEIEAIKYGILL